MPLKKMNPEYKERWLKALRGRGYRQGTGVLRAKRGGPKPEYCCLGVLVNIDDDLKWEAEGKSTHNQFFLADGTDHTVQLGNKLLKKYGISTAAQNHLIAMNDGGDVCSEAGNFITEYDKCSFKQIADWIEENL